MKRIGVVERSGRGVDTIYRGMLKFGRSAPDYTRTDAQNVVLRMPTEPADLEFRRMLSAAVYGAVADKAAYTRQAGFAPIQNEQMALSYVRQHGHIKRAEAMELCRLSEWQTKQLLKRMCDVGAIVLHGSGKASAYLSGHGQTGRFSE